MPHNKDQGDQINLLRSSKARYLLADLIAQCDPNAQPPEDMKAWLLADTFVETAYNTAEIGRAIETEEQLDIRNQPCAFLDELA